MNTWHSLCLRLWSTDDRLLLGSFFHHDLPLYKFFRSKESYSVLFMPFSLSYRFSLFFSDLITIGILFIGSFHDCIGNLFIQFNSIFISPVWNVICVKFQVWCFRKDILQQVFVFNLLPRVSVMGNTFKCILFLFFCKFLILTHSIEHHYKLNISNFKRIIALHLKLLDLWNILFIFFSLFPLDL